MGKFLPRRQKQRVAAGERVFKGAAGRSPASLWKGGGGQRKDFKWRQIKLISLPFWATTRVDRVASNFSLILKIRLKKN